MNRLIGSILMILAGLLGIGAVGVIIWTYLRPDIDVFMLSQVCQRGITAVVAGIAVTIILGFAAALIQRLICRTKQRAIVVSVDSVSWLTKLCARVFILAVFQAWQSGYESVKFEDGKWIKEHGRGSPAKDLSHEEVTDYLRRNARTEGALALGVACSWILFAKRMIAGQIQTVPTENPIQTRKL